MQNNSSLAHKSNNKRASSGIGGKVFAFLSGVLVGTVVVSLIVVNFYAGSSIQRSLLPEHEQQHFHQPHRRQQLKQKLRIERPSSSDVHDEDDAGISSSSTTFAMTFNKTYNNKNNNGSVEKSKSLSSSSLELRTTQDSTTRSSFEEPSFFELARETGTDKVKGVAYLPSCLEDDSTCTRPSCEREQCRPWGHFYHTMYQQKLSKFLNPDESFQLLEIGYVRIIS